MRAAFQWKQAPKVFRLRKIQVVRRAGRNESWRAFQAGSRFAKNVALILLARLIQRRPYSAIQEMLTPLLCDGVPARRGVLGGVFSWRHPQ
jgi:hypothetical protein